MAFLRFTAAILGILAAASVFSFNWWLVVTSVILFFLAISGRRRRPRMKRSWWGKGRRAVLGASPNHGNAKWMTMKEARRVFRGPHGVVVGEALDISEVGGTFDPEDKSTWGPGGKAPLLIDPCRMGSTHSMVFAGSGWFKTSAVAIPTMLSWKWGSKVMIDPAGEASEMISGVLETEHENRVFCLNPVRPEGARRWGMDVFDWIDTKRDRFAAMHVASVCSSLFSDPPSKEDPQTAFWREWGRELVTCLSMDLLWDDNPPGPKNLATVKEMLSTPENQMRDLLKFINANSRSRVASKIAGQIMGIVDETFSGIYATANQQTGWLNYPEFADLVAGNAFRTSDLLDGKTTIFIQIPTDIMRSRPGLARVLVTALFNAVRQAKGDFPGRVLFELDEVAFLGRLEAVQNMLTADRKHGITGQLLYQDVGQLEQQWDAAGRDTFMNAMNWIGYASVFDLKTAKTLSEWCGNRSVLAFSQSETSGTQAPGGMRGMFKSRSKSTSNNVHEIRAPLIRPETILHETRADEMYVTVRGHSPLRVSRSIYFRRPDMASKVLESRYHRAQ